MKFFRHPLSMIKSFLDPADAYRQAQKEAERGWGQAEGFQRPFMEHGQEQYDPLNQAREKLMNPMDLQNEWADAYEKSPYAQNLLRENRTQGMESAGSMGLMGSSAALKNIQQGAGDIVAKDRQRFLDDLMQKYMAGIGLGENLYGTGAQAGANLGQEALSHGNDMAQLRYGRAAAPGKLFGQGLGMAIGAFNPDLAERMNKFNPGGA